PRTAEITPILADAPNAARQLRLRGIAGADMLSAWLEVHDPAAAAQRGQSLVPIFDQTRPQLSPRPQIFSPTSAQTLISEFESYMPSHAVGLRRLLSAAKNSPSVSLEG